MLPLVFILQYPVIYIYSVLLFSSVLGSLDFLSIRNTLRMYYSCEIHLKITSNYVLLSSNVTEVMVKVHVVDLKAESVAAPITVRAYLNQTVTEFKQLISKVSFKRGL